ncbi:hypothetical protein B9Z55_007433 [Caenorhabditis nigoni]|uniref:SCP domain-containing protein n=1 Tax=Caenorhabditis nigoni TaxID=1611254 RepID=A0A2G5V9M5_9PELO|nr:hypothetical protein B9Z55_007433 [Caenorhabditis nigoni]
MKSLLVLLLLVPTTFCLPNAFSRGSCLQLINAARSAFADKLQLANMNELVYNKKLEKKALEQLSYSGPCPQPSIISQNHLDIYLNVKGHDLIVDLLSATGSTQMACVRSKCGDEDVISIVTDVQDSSPISGPPGTQCSSERLANSQGLCTQEYSRGGYARKVTAEDLKEGLEAVMPTTIFGPFFPPFIPIFG